MAINQHNHGAFMGNAVGGMLVQQIGAAIEVSAAEHQAMFYQSQAAMFQQGGRLMQGAQQTQPQSNPLLLLLEDV